MIKRNYKIKENLRLYVPFIFLMLFSIGTVWAEGSKDLYPSGATGGRAYLRASNQSNLAFPFPNLGTHYVYAEAGERIALATSAQAYGSNSTDRNANRNNIRLYGPNGNEITLSRGNNTDVRGRIDNRNAELAGPQLPGETGGGRYTPIYYEVTVTGIYKVEYLSTSRSTTGESRMGYQAANSSWSQSDESNYLTAWDISVAQQTSGNKWEWVTGRVFTYVLNMDNPSYIQSGNQFVFRNNSGFHGKFKVLTRDGYVYNVDNNGSQGISFTFMVNNRGFHEEGDPNSPSYASIPINSTNQNPGGQIPRRYHDPRKADSEAVVTQKIFYSLPDSNMPEYAKGGVVSNAETWLRIPQKDLNVTGLKVVGAEGSNNQIGSKGAYIEFTNESGGDYYITIRPKTGSGNNFPERLLTGPSVVGENRVYWDGKDGNGNNLPHGISDVNVELKLRGAEVHFPYIDMELNQYGIKIELLSVDFQHVVSDRVYWNDNPIGNGGGSNGSKTNPRNASHTIYPNGTSSSTNGHIWGLNTNATTNTFGDEQGMDTWTFIEGEAMSVGFDVDVKIADLYTDIKYKVNNQNTASSGGVGNTIEYNVTAGNKGPSDIKGGKFTFSVPVGVDISNTDNISFTTSCNNGTVVQSESLVYNEKTRTFSSMLDLPNGCSITYTFTGTLSGVLGLKTAESTILRPADVYDPDATNGDIDTPPTNPHYECYNNADGGGSTGGCNNIQEVTFMLLQDCTEEYLYYEDFARGFWATNDGRTDWSQKLSIGLNATTGLPTYSNGIIQRGGPAGGATGSYLFAPGVNDSRYAAANVSPHSASISVARIKNGYYSVNPPSYVQMGIPTTDSWHQGLWVPNAPSNDPNLPNSNYDWTPAWNTSDAIRDASGAVNGAAFHVRGAASASQSIKPFYEFVVPGTIQDGQTYTLSLYSYVTYHDKDYMIMDVVDKNSGHVYASVPLKYTGQGLPPGASPEGFSLGWVPLQASVKFENQDCEESVSGKEIKIAIRGSQDRSLESGKGFGHTLIDDVSFSRRSADGACDIPASTISCADACYTDISGKGYKWYYGTGQASGSISENFQQPATNGGFVMDIYYLDNSFNMEINGAPLYEKELEFQSGVSESPQNVRFKSDKKMWENDNIPPIWRMNTIGTGGTNFDIIDINFDDIHSNPTPAIRVRIDKWGNVKLYGKRTQEGDLEELEVFDSTTGLTDNLNVVHWVTESTDPTANKVKVSQKVVSVTAMTVYGYGQNEKDCETCTIEKEGVFDDNNNDGFAHVGETISYTFDVKNAGDMDIYDIEIIDPLFGFNIKLDENTHQPTQEGVTLEGDNNSNGVLNRSETWTFKVKYKVTATDVFETKGVYNRATVTGIGQLPNSNKPTQVIDEDSTDPTPYKDGDEGWDPNRPFHTFVPLKGSGLLITNPMIYQRTK